MLKNDDDNDEKCNIELDFKDIKKKQLYYIVGGTNCISKYRRKNFNSKYYTVN